MRITLRTYRNAFLTVALLTSCDNTDRSDTIPGIYTSQAGGTFGNSKDTLFIEAQGADMFRVLRRGRFVRRHQMDTDTGLTHDEYVARFEPETQTLQSGPRGRSIRVDPDRKRLWFGSRVYYKSR